MYEPNTQQLTVFNLSERKQLLLFDYFKNVNMHKNPPQFKSSQGFTISFVEAPAPINSYYKALIEFSKYNSCILYVQLHDLEDDHVEGSKGNKHVHIIEDGIPTNITKAINTLINWEQLHTTSLKNKNHDKRNTNI